MAKDTNEVSLGSFAAEKETARFYRFSRPDGDSGAFTHYVLKDVLAELGNPETIEIVIRTV